MLVTACKQASDLSSNSTKTSAQAQNADINNELLVYCAEGSPVTLNPQTSTSGTTVDATSPTIFNQLLDYEPGTTNLRPRIAESWEISEDGLQYRFKLKKDIAFHSNQHFSPTRSLNADDVIFSIERQRDPMHPLYQAAKGRYPYFQSQGLAQLIQNIRKIDEHQLEIQLNRPESPFLAILATPYLPIQSKEYAEVLAQKNQLELFDKAPIGTGPFQLVDYQVDSLLRFKAFEEHFAGVSAIQNLVYAITPDPAMRFARFSAGECDIMRYPLPVHLKLAEQQAQIQSNQIAGLNVAYWAFNTEKAPFNQPKVRQALSYAINRKAIIRAVYDQQATIADSPIPTTSWAYQKPPQPIVYNPAKAKSLLAEAGYDKGLSLDIWAMPVQRGYNPNARKMAEMIQQDLTEIGVKAQIISFQWGTFLRRVRLGHHQTVLLGWNADNGDPDNFLTPLLSCLASQNRGNYARWCNQNFDRIIKRARLETDPEQRKKLYQQAQAMFQQEQPWLTIAYAQNSLLFNHQLNGVQLSPLGSISFEGVSFLNPQADSPKIDNPQTDNPQTDNPLQPLEAEPMAGDEKP
ncbi:ABC transporter substrate-binding protein [Kangiella sp. TOML190]|uniref:ABC transporter substrate-binding protein n=1 Tax=Kangiella sp. TOML190 TaxID=2931351 RepID=UPI00203D2E3A|nr:ABC transporter substrate-binding protein [Kangiella sp. TOML190]